MDSQGLLLLAFTAAVFGELTSCSPLKLPSEDGSCDKWWNEDSAGTPDIGATTLNCTWWNRKHMECSWSPGEKESPDTSYKLFYWYPLPNKEHERYRNVTCKGPVFRCSFELEVDRDVSINMSILGDSGNSQPSRMLFQSINSLELTSCSPLKLPSEDGSCNGRTEDTAGTPGTGATNLNCTWWNRKHMECLWSPGEKESPDTSYKLFYQHPLQNKEHDQYRNFTCGGPVFRCSFELELDNVRFINMSILSDSGNIQPSHFRFRSINRLVKCDPPVITNISQNGSQVFLSWTQPCNLKDMNYEVEVDCKPRPFKDTLSATIPVEPDVRHTFRVRLKTEVGQWSDWSKMVVLDGTTSTFPILWFILIPLCVALLLVILLIYLNRIKLLVLPKIPDPEKILKNMFEGQNENQPMHETANNEEIHLLMIVEPAGNEK